MKFLGKKTVGILTWGMGIVKLTWGIQERENILVVSFGTHCSLHRRWRRKPSTTLARITYHFSIQSSAACRDRGFLAKENNTNSQGWFHSKGQWQRWELLSFLEKRDKWIIQVSWMGKDTQHPVEKNSTLVSHDVLIMWDKEEMETGKLFIQWREHYGDSIRSNWRPWRQYFPLNLKRKSHL